MRISFKNLFFQIAFAIGLFAVMALAKSVLIPLSVALLTAFILLPVVKKLEGWGFKKSLATFIAMFISFIIIGGTITLFSAEILRISEQMTDFSGKITSTFSNAVVYANNNINFVEDLDKEKLIQNGKTWIKESSGSLIQNTFSSTAELLAWFISIIIFTFLILTYRVGLTNAFLAFSPAENQSNILRMLKNVQRVGKKYLSGMFLLILILGLANSIGLWIIGIESPFLFGYLAAFLSIVPYIGTTIGATIPVLYAFMTSDSLWIPIAVIALFWSIQTIESNILSPKIIGSNLNVNPLAAILSLLIGASMWGIAGMILFLPFAAMLKVICEEFEQLRPIALLIGTDIAHDQKKKPKALIVIEKIVTEKIKGLGLLKK